MADDTIDKEKEFEFRLRYEQEQAAAKPKEEPDQVNPLYGAGAGLIAGPFVGPMANETFKGVNRKAAAHAAGVPANAMEWDSAGQKWARSTGYGAGEGKTVQEVDAAYKKMQAELNGPLGKGKVASKISGPMNLESFEAAQAKEAARQAIFAEQRAKEAAAMRSSVPLVNKAATAFGVPQGVQKVANALYSGASKAPAVLGRGIAGVGVGAYGADMYNRLQQGDITGGVVSGLGALGSAAAFIPHPVTRVGGTAIGIGAEALNLYLDSLKKKPPQMAKGGLVDEEDGLSKAEKAALLIMKNKKKRD
jgi:hypothetical protein